MREREEEKNIQSVPSISNTIPFNFCTPSSPSLPSAEEEPKGAKRRFPCEAMLRIGNEKRPRAFLLVQMPGIDERERLNELYWELQNERARATVLKSMRCGVV